MSRVRNPTARMLAALGRSLALATISSNNSRSARRNNARNRNSTALVPYLPATTALATRPARRRRGGPAGPASNSRRPIGGQVALRNNPRPQRFGRQFDMAARDSTVPAAFGSTIVTRPMQPIVRIPFTSTTLGIYSNATGVARFSPSTDIFVTRLSPLLVLSGRAVFGGLGYIAAFFREFRLSGLRLRYHPQVPTNQAGNLMLAVTADASIANSATQAAFNNVSQMDGATAFPVWQPQDICIPAGCYDRDWKYTDVAASLDDADERLEGAGAIIVSSAGGLPNNFFWGLVEISGVMELRSFASNLDIHTWMDQWMEQRQNTRDVLHAARQQQREHLMSELGLEPHQFGIRPEPIHIEQDEDVEMASLPSTASSTQNRPAPPAHARAEPGKHATPASTGFFSRG